MNQLTKAEERIMQIIWRLERCLVSDILKYIEEEQGEDKPPHSSVSSIVRILEEKGFVAHKAYGRTYEYFPVVSREAYTKSTLSRLVSDYFEGSMNNLVSFLVKEENINAEELSSLLDKIKE